MDEAKRSARSARPERSKRREARTINDDGVDRGEGDRSGIDDHAIDAVIAWYRERARELPWREPTTAPWGVLVSEIMLQQTPVARVRPRWLAWMERWPTPAALADAPTAEVLRAWDRLGYPRRALRLQECAVALRDHHGGDVPRDHDALLALPGIGPYTAAAICAFAFGQRVIVLDVNVRRVLARAMDGIAAPTASIRRAERDAAAELMPQEPERAVAWHQSVMELGALVCTARSPQCERCPLARRCRWLASGRPASVEPRRVQAFAGTDRELRGRIMALLRAADEVALDEIAALPARDPEQTERCIRSLRADGLAVLDGDRLRLP